MNGSPLPTFHVFVSSTWLDLQLERGAVERALQRIRETKFIGMEYFGSREETTRDVSLAEIERCQVYVGIFGGRYGSGITEAEYRRARERGLPCFIYTKPNAHIGPEWRDHDGDKGTSLATLMSDLRNAHDVSEFTNPDDLAARVTADLHRWLAEVYYAPDLGKAARSELPQYRMEALLAALGGLGSLVQQLQRAAAVPAAQAVGNRSVAIAGANTGMIHTGDIILQIFNQAAPPISQHIRVAQFRNLIEERTRGFVGRAFVFAALDRLLGDPAFASGYITIHGEPGIGKTALSGELVKRRGYVHHFNVATQNIRSTRDFLTNVCAQMIVRYQLAYPVLPAEATTDSGFLMQLLREAAAKSGESPVVVVVDALDEADDTGLAPGANRLYLPSSLPDRVFFVVTTRAQADYRLAVDHREAIYLQEKDPQNLDDVREYIVQFVGAHRVEMASRIAEWGISEDDFARIITDRSEGNFMYLVHVLRDIQKGRITRLTLADIGQLPAGLREYYQRHWRQMKAHDTLRFEDYYEPVLCLLATAVEPVGLSQIIEWTTERRGKPSSPMRVKEVIDDWHEFLNDEVTAGGVRLYRLYHASFQDFLREEVGLASYHSAIAQSALDKIAGWPRE